MEARSEGELYRLVIIGGGPAGYTAALYAARAGLHPLLLEGDEPGGQLMQTTTVENFPGFPDGVQGPELMQRWREQAQHFGAEIRAETATRIDLSQRPFRIEAGGREIAAETLILAMGASARRLGLEAEKRLTGRGVSTCATCDGFFFRGKRVAVVGGGDSACEEALYLAKLAESVTLIHRRSELRASRILQERVRAEPKININWNAVVEDIYDVAAGKVTGVALRDTVTGERRELSIDGLFVAIGHVPNTALVKGQLELDEHGYIRVKGTGPGATATSIPGVFAAGDVQDPFYRQAVTAAASGCQAAMDVERFLEGSSFHDWGLAGTGSAADAQR
ncbi:MAG: thioredoxin-disulfide reductase [Limnochordales bacterium]|nr:thioredoxin-disulfide reductase [Limnochordales bacterium]